MRDLLGSLLGHTALEINLVVSL